MQELLKPIRTESLKDVCVARLEELILSGRVAIGRKLPSERELALQLGVSRPVVHEGLLDMAAKGLVSMIPRVGTVVNDYRKEGSIALLTSLLNYHNGKLEPKLLESLLKMRALFETETARLAAINRTGDHLRALNELLEAEANTASHRVAEITRLDFQFHHRVALASGNVIYPLLINSFKQFYTSLSGQFFDDSRVVSVVFDFHRKLVDAFVARDANMAEEIMMAMLAHGEKHLIAMIEENKPLNL